MWRLVTATRTAAAGIVLVLCSAIVLGAVREKPMLVNARGGSQAVWSRDGELLRLSTSDDERYRLWIALGEIHQKLIDATLLQEDRWFRWHPGINPVSVARAFATTYLSGGRRVGGSTLTMQLARLRFGIDSRTALGKLEQMARALLIEWHYSKDEILEAYLNLAPYGGNVEGVGAASLIYFGKPVTSLDWREALTLSVIPKSPRRRSPATSAGREELADARQRLAKQALAVGWTERGLEASLKQRDQLPFRAPHFVERVMRETSFAPQLRTTLDSRAQWLVETQIHQFVSRNAALGIRNASALLVEYPSMAVRAYVGSANYGEDAIHGQVDGVHARRSPGSALKPFVYALGLDQGRINPRSMLKDTSLSISAYNPENFDREFLGPIDATEALVRSRNLPAIQLANQLHDPDLFEFLAQAGVRDMRSRDFYGLALALGGGEIRMDELAELYGLLANGGEVRRLRFVDEEDEDRSGRRLLSPEAAHLAIDMLRENPRPGVARGAGRATERDVPWKTGTSFGFRDAWAAGIAGPYVLVVWVGNFDGVPNPAFVGREAAGPLFFSIIDALRSVEPLREPPAQGVRLVRREVCALSGELPNRHCPHRRETWLIPGKSAIAECSIHRTVAIDTASGWRACPGQVAGVREEVFEFWPSDLLALFRESGLARRVPPPIGRHCAQSAERGRAPMIALPQETVEYLVPSDGEGEIPFSAVTDADSRTVYWFVDESPVGESRAGETYYWPARPGRFTVRAVDDQGRSVATHVSVALHPDDR